MRVIFWLCFVFYISFSLFLVRIHVRSFFKENVLYSKSSRRLSFVSRNNNVRRADESNPYHKISHNECSRHLPLVHCCTHCRSRFFICFGFVFCRSLTAKAKVFELWVLSFLEVLNKFVLFWTCCLLLLLSSVNNAQWCVLVFCFGDCGAVVISFAVFLRPLTGQRQTQQKHHQSNFSDIYQIFLVKCFFNL